MYPSPARVVRGMAATEFVLVSIPLLLAGLGAFEAAHWNLVRQAVSFALLEGARAGAVSHADPAAIRAALQKGLQPLGDGSRHLPDGQPPWQIDILSPRAAHFVDFPGPHSNGMRTIHHAYQDIRHRQALAAGLPGRRGMASGDTIFGANTLSLRLHYVHVPIVPGMRSLLRRLGAALPDAGFAAQAMRRAGALPVRQTVSITMQSSPWDWQHGGVVAPAAAPPGRQAAMPAQTPASAPPCGGIWCDVSWAGRSWQPVPAAPLPPASAAVPANPAPLPWDDTGQACQAALCCVEASG
jgi:hypothetical protein